MRLPAGPLPRCHWPTDAPGFLAVDPASISGPRGREGVGRQGRCQLHAGDAGHREGRQDALRAEEEQGEISSFSDWTVIFRADAWISVVRSLGEIIRGIG